MALDENKLKDFVLKAIGDLGAALTASLVVIGDRLGLYKAMAAGGPMTPEELASRTDTKERYVREWLAGQAASGYVTYDTGSGRFYLTEEQAVALADEQSPAYVVGGFIGMTAAMKAEPRIREAFRSGDGLPWHEHDAALFEGTERFFRPAYNAHLVDEWLPALDGVVDKLQSGARVADVGCGHGASTLVMARAFPNSEFVGFDYHPASVEAARERAKAAGLTDRVSFERAAAKEFPGQYDLVAFFDCLHDMGDPVGAGAHVLDRLEGDGTWLVVEPFAHDRVEDNMNLIGRVFYSVSTLVCTPASLSQEVGRALGAQAGESRLREVAKEAGFTRFRRAAETPFNMVLEIRP
jgi:SAM-dependent methyltransferase